MDWGHQNILPKLFHDNRFLHTFQSAYLSICSNNSKAQATSQNDHLRSQQYRRQGGGWQQGQFAPGPSVRGPPNSAGLVCTFNLNPPKIGSPRNEFFRNTWTHSEKVVPTIDLFLRVWLQGWQLLFMFPW